MLLEHRHQQAGQAALGQGRQQGDQPVQDQGRRQGDQPVQDQERQQAGRALRERRSQLQDGWALRLSQALAPLAARPVPPAVLRAASRRRARDARSKVSAERFTSNAPTA